MQKFFLILLCALTACHSTKRLGKHTIETPVQDSILHTVDVQDTGMNVFSLQQKLIDSLDSCWPSFTTADARIKLSYTDQNQAADLSAHIVMVKDSLTWISVTGPFNFEVMRLLVVNDTVQVIDRFHKTYLIRPFSYLATVTGIPFTHHSFQSVLLGKPFITDSAVTGVQRYENDLYSVILSGHYSSAQLYLKGNEKQPVQAVFTDSASMRTVSFQYGDYSSTGTGKMPFTCTANVKSYLNLPETLLMETYWTVKEITWNKPVEYLFVKPENYSQQ